MRTTALALTMLTLAACRTDPPAPPPPAPGDECGASRLSDLIGQPYNDDWTRTARRRGPVTVIRGIRPGDAVTMDYNPRRLNAEIGADGRVTRLRCG